MSGRPEHLGSHVSTALDFRGNMQQRYLQENLQNMYWKSAVDPQGQEGWEMDLKGKKIGVAVTGSFCTFEKMFQELQRLTEEGAEVYPVFSKAAQETDSRFGRAEDFLQRTAEITGKTPIVSIAGAEPTVN